jgi:hypothetical protein
MIKVYSAGQDAEKQELEREIQQLKEKIEHAMLPNIAFEEESQSLREKVCS